MTRSFDRGIAPPDALNTDIENKEAPKPLDISALVFSQDDERPLRNEGERGYVKEIAAMFHGQEVSLLAKKTNSVLANGEEREKNMLCKVMFPQGYVELDFYFFHAPSGHITVSGYIEKKSTDAGVSLPKHVGLDVYRQGLAYIERFARSKKTVVTHKVEAVPSYGLSIEKWLTIFEPLLVEYGYTRSDKQSFVWEKTYRPV
ncbi:MAG: hypothetical protein COU33_03440 [Candidatus Magasanikbacteria bacterium CG10_big_fil_rev_8_21_14_0_10_43_6]|uniref:Uncharacterized protein n=1 Tax=Candidatus Magasanikbacteria bacterium CG10_big_fil_rev_8_21_14_0_10_43_6 TaxID=1974650 RepID=A0A2M6W0S6_9BACT|nr:MAG: hypothetical protein COU33_03440 [Candidatus Magasanikbacteria bacterium CG10_big_fil_rev_8_21_14_0_10_43_6]